MSQKTFSHKQISTSDPAPISSLLPHAQYSLWLPSKWTSIVLTGLFMITLERRSPYNTFLPFVSANNSHNLFSSSRLITSSTQKIISSFQSSFSVYYHTRWVFLSLPIHIHPRVTGKLLTVKNRLCHRKYRTPSHRAATGHTLSVQAKRYLKHPPPTYMSGAYSRKTARRAECQV